MIVADKPDVDSVELATYAYSYPHKSSYDRLAPAISIRDAWRHEDVRKLALYVHIPFCEMRCGFCNLFTQSQPAEGFVSAYLATLDRQASIMREHVPDACFEQCAIGGGTPTYLSPVQLTELVRQIEHVAGRPLRELSTSVEVSPETATPERLRVLADYGVRRISIGVQSFLRTETQRLGRSQDAGDVYRALELIRDLGFPQFNIDLIYGDSQQSPETWTHSLREALRFRPEELYLYPLYVRPQTGLAGLHRRAAESRAELYLVARDLLCAAGYQQASLRCFRLPGQEVATRHSCQSDGMIGLGCGARSYTSALHYATRFAVTQAGVRAILAEWIGQSDQELALATHGIWLTRDEQKRRFVLLSLLQSDGLSLAEFARRFGSQPLEEFSALGELIARGWIMRSGARVVLTPSGVQASDYVGPMLYSESVRRRLVMFTSMFGADAEAQSP